MFLCVNREAPGDCVCHRQLLFTSFGNWKVSQQCLGGTAFVPLLLTTVSNGLILSPKGETGVYQHFLKLSNIYPSMCLLGTYVPSKGKLN